MAPRGGAAQPAVCDCAPMRDGVHYAEFTHRGPYPRLHIGVVDGRFDPSASTADSPKPAHQDPVGATWMLKFDTGKLDHGTSVDTGYEGKRKQQKGWPNQTGASVGETLGLLLDLNQGSLTVYKDGQRIGVAVPSGSLTGPQYWAADVFCNASDSRGCSAVTITRKPPP